MLIPGSVISLLTFPGIIVHEWAHKKFCEWTRVDIYKVVYFSFGNPAGFVLHEPPDTYSKIFWISIGPLIVNSAITVILGLVLSQILQDSWLYSLLFWLAVSVGMHAFPSDQDMAHIASASSGSLRAGGSLLHYLSFPFVALVWIANKLRFFWFDVGYAVLLIMSVGGLK